jgi:hypothetical protein
VSLSVEDMISFGGHFPYLLGVRAPLLCHSTTRGLTLERSANAGALLADRRGAPFRRRGGGGEELDGRDLVARRGAPTDVVRRLLHLLARDRRFHGTGGVPGRILC